MSTSIYYVDAFTDKLFSGNPAAVIFSQIKDEQLMQKIAAENNLSETAFIREENGIFHIRWFAPLCEIDLCGHATLASAYIFFKYIKPESSMFEVQSLKNGILKVTKKNNLLVLDFPKDSLSQYNEFSLIEEIININPIELYRGRDDVLVIVETEDSVRNLDINFELLNKINARGLIVSAEGTKSDFVSRFFVVHEWIDEFEKATKELSSMVLNKKILYRETITKGFENAPQALRDILTGKNFGKQVIEI